MMQPLADGLGESAMFPPDDLLRSVARAGAPTSSTAPSIDELDTVIALDALARRIVEHNRRLLAGEPVDWDVLACQFDKAQGACRRLDSSAPISDDAAAPRRPGERLDTSPIYE